VTLGSKGKLLEFFNDKLTTDSTNLISKLSDLEDVDVTLATTNYQMSQVVYKASLQVSATILQTNLLDFLK
jgi:flagellin-like hook-associated protein FlgL